VYILIFLRVTLEIRYGNDKQLILVKSLS
jgi:hypothetical protein